MYRYQSRVSALGILVLGIATLLPSTTFAGAFDFFKSKKRSSKPTISRTAYNQQVANKIAGKLRGAQLKGYNIQVEYQNGTATLTGQVTDSSQKRKANQIVRRISGVKRVKNRLVLLPQKQSRSVIQQTAATEPAPFPTPAPAVSEHQTTSTGNNQQVAEQIAGAVSSAGFNGFDIEVRYRDGKAVLNGKVGSPSQKARATAVVSRVPGVSQVVNNLVITGGPGVQQRRQRPQRQGYRQARFQSAPVPPQAGGRPNSAMGQGGGRAPQMMGHSGASLPHNVYNQPNLPEYAWPAYAAHNNYAQVNYPKQHSASAWPYIGPFYPYPQVPLGWRQVQLEWDDGYWNLNFQSRTDKWWWFLQPKNW